MATQTVTHVLPQSKAPAVVIPFPKPAPALKLRAAKNHTAGVCTFYAASDSKAGVEYVLQLIRRGGQRRWFCDCADFKFRRLARRRHCKHLHGLLAMVRAAGGVRRLIRSLTAAPELPEPPAVQGDDNSPFIGAGVLHGERDAAREELYA